MQVMFDFNRINSFNGTNLNRKDLSYKKALQKGLKDTFDINCKIEDLASVATPAE